MTNQDGNTADYGKSTAYYKFNTVWLRRIYNTIKGVDVGTTPHVDANADLNEFGIQPVAVQATPAFPIPVTLYNDDSKGTKGTPLITGLVNATVQLVNDGVTVYTVTTGKTFYCMGVVLSHNANGGATEEIKSGATVVVEVFMDTTATTNAPISITSTTPIFSSASGVVITVTGAGASHNSVTLFGYEI